VRVGVGVMIAGASGLPAIVLETALGLHSAGVPVTLFMTHDAVLPPHAYALERSARRLEALPAPLRNSRIEHALQLPHRLLLGRRLAAALADETIDVLHLFSSALAAVVPARLPTVVQSWFYPPDLPGRLRTMMPLAPRGPLAPVRLAGEIQAHAGDLLGYRRAALVLANTPSAERALRARGLPTQHIPPCITVRDQSPDRSQSSVLRLVFAAYNLATPRKGLTLLLEALPLLGPGRVHLTLVGAWSDEIAAAVARVRHAGTEVRAVGRLPREHYLELLAREADLFVMPSLYEEWGFALSEALSLGVPVLALPVYPFADVVDDSVGFLAADKTPEAIAAALERALTDGLPKREDVISVTRATLGADAIAPRLIAAYEQVISEVGRERTAGVAASEQG
jgi:glycosyltransferase involved in cell wall biosynthesis